MENVSHDTSYSEDDDAPPNMDTSTNHIQISSSKVSVDYDEIDVEGESDDDIPQDVDVQVEHPPYKETHFYALLLFMDAVNGVFKKSDEVKIAYDKISNYRSVFRIISFSEIKKLKNQLELKVEENEFFMSTVNYQKEQLEMHKNKSIKEESKQDFGTLNLQDSDSKNNIFSHDKFMSIFEKQVENDDVSELTSKQNLNSPALNKEIQTVNIIVESHELGDDSSMLLYPPMASSIKPLDERFNSPPPKIEVCDRAIQAEQNGIEQHDIKILQNKLAKTESKFDKIFVVLDEIAHKFPDYSQFLLEARRDLEVEIGALALEKREMASKRKELHLKAETLTDIEIKNLENSVYLENRIQEYNKRLAEVNQIDFSKTVEVCNADIQTSITCDQLQEAEVELLSYKKGFEVDVMMLNEKVKAKEKEFKFNYGK